MLQVLLLSHGSSHPQTVRTDCEVQQFYHLYFTNNSSTEINQTNKIKYLTWNHNQYPVWHFFN